MLVVTGWTAVALALLLLLLAIQTIRVRVRRGITFGDGAMPI